MHANSKKESKPIEYKYDDRHQSLLASIIVAERAGIPYYIRTIEDLINYGLQETVISYDMLEAFCRIHKDTHQSQVKYLLNDRGIQLVSEGDWFRVGADGNIGKIEDQKEYAGHIRDYPYTTNPKVVSEPCDQNIIINLRLNEILATLINIGHEKETPIPLSKIKENFEPKHINEFVKLGLLIQENGNFLQPSKECSSMSSYLVHETNLPPDKKLFIRINRRDTTVIRLFREIRVPFLRTLMNFPCFQFTFGSTAKTP